MGGVNMNQDNLQDIFGNIDSLFNEFNDYIEEIIEEEN